MTDRADPWSVAVIVEQIPEGGLHRDIEADRPRAAQWRSLQACATFSSRMLRLT